MLQHWFSTNVLSRVFSQKFGSQGKFYLRSRKERKTRLRIIDRCVSSVILGKLLEAVVKKQLTSHLENVLPSNIFGFRPGRSTNDAVGYTLDKIRQLRADGKIVAILAMDASSAFDCISHDLILNSLEIIGVGQRMRSWIASFLNGCKNFVQIGDGKSEEWVVESGSGQGRRLSPDLYNIASLSQAILFVALSFFAGYADDGIDIVFGSSDAECDNKLQALVHERKEWYMKVGLP